MPVLALQGIRGGIGTTSVIAALAWALQQLDESVLVIDFSPDNLLRLHFNMSFEQSRGWARAEVDGEGWQQGAMRYAEKLDLLPFGQLTQAENEQLSASLQQHPRQWQENLSRLLANASYRWILLDIPVGDSAFTRQALALADQTLILIHADASCHIRLHQQNLPAGCHFYLISSLPAAVYNRIYISSGCKVWIAYYPYLFIATKQWPKHWQPNSHWVNTARKVWRQKK